MKKYLPIIVFILNIVYLTILFLSIFLTPQLVKTIYSLILSVMFLLFWFYFPMTNKKKNKK